MNIGINHAIACCVSITLGYRDNYANADVLINSRPFLDSFSGVSKLHSVNCLMFHRPIPFS